MASVDPASAFLHEGRINDSGTYIAEHIDIDPADTTADSEFTANFVLPRNLRPGEQYLQVTSSWAGADEAYREDGIAPSGTPGLGGGVNDRVAMARVTITFSPSSYDENGNGVVDRSEVIEAINDYLYGALGITSADVIGLINLYLAN